jgi:hypothetical protein
MTSSSAAARTAHSAAPEAGAMRGGGAAARARARRSRRWAAVDGTCRAGRAAARARCVPRSPAAGARVTGTPCVAVSSLPLCSLEPMR